MNFHTLAPIFFAVWNPLLFPLCRSSHRQRRINQHAGKHLHQGSSHGCDLEQNRCLSLFEVTSDPFRVNPAPSFQPPGEQPQQKALFPFILASDMGFFLLFFYKTMDENSLVLVFYVGPALLCFNRTVWSHISGAQIQEQGPDMRDKSSERLAALIYGFKCSHICPIDRDL